MYRLHINKPLSARFAVRPRLMKFQFIYTRPLCQGTYALLEFAPN